MSLFFALRRYRRRLSRIKLLAVGVITCVVIFLILGLMQGSNEGFVNDLLHPGQGLIAFETRLEMKLGDDRMVDLQETEYAAEMNRSIKKYGLNKFASDRMSLKREHDDFRSGRCRNIEYDKDLPTASVIIIFFEEAVSAILRTVWSIIRMTPHNLLKEIILVDDGSTFRELRYLLPEYIQKRFPSKVILRRHSKQNGLIRARLTGAKAATGDVLIFLDAHCETLEGWVEPLLQAIKDDRKTVVVPDIESIDHETMELESSTPSGYTYVGGFSWSGDFLWNMVDVEENEVITKTPTIAGGLFAMEAKYFWEIGGYDDGMVGWGAENLEISFRVWTCGGRMVQASCSHVGHIFRLSRPYQTPKDCHGLNMVRLSEVWWDRYKRFYYMTRPDLNKTKKKAGDYSDRALLRNRLQCKPFKWYLDNIAPEKYILDEHALYFGKVKNQGKHVCLDHLHREDDTDGTPKPYFLGAYLCNRHISRSQFFSLSKMNQLRNEFYCAVKATEKKTGLNKVRMEVCKKIKLSPRTKWAKTSAGQLRHIESNLCLTLPDEGDGEVDVTMEKCKHEESQLWNFTKRSPELL